jgi:hypothetical protein
MRCFDVHVDAPAERGSCGKPHLSIFALVLLLVNVSAVEACRQTSLVQRAETLATPIGSKPHPQTPEMATRARVAT